MTQFKKILCPVDFSKTSDRAFDYALKLAGHYDAAVHALHVISPVIPAAYGMPFSIQDMTADLKKESERLLKKHQARGEKAGVRVTTRVLLGDIDSEVLRAVKKENADLLIMGTHGRRGFERLALGSETERMLRHCPVPMLTVGPHLRSGAIPPAIRRILFTTDFSAGSQEAVKYAISLAQECNAKLTLLHVVHDAAADFTSKYHDALVRGVETGLQELVPAGALNSNQIDLRVEAGVPFEVIPEIAKSGRFDLLVMNVHGKSITERVFLGSTAERTLRAVTDVCTVLLIPPMGRSHRRRAA